MTELRSAVSVFDPDLIPVPALAYKLDFSDHAGEVPLHVHRKGQLILALRGAVTCRAGNELWVVPPNCGVWIPVMFRIARVPRRTHVLIICLSRQGRLICLRPVVRCRSHR